jgi:hypothetical protein
MLEIGTLLARDIFQDITRFLEFLFAGRLAPAPAANRK